MLPDTEVVTAVLSVIVLGLGRCLPLRHLFALHLTSVSMIKRQREGLCPAMPASPHPPAELTLEETGLRWDSCSTSRRKYTFSFSSCVPGVMDCGRGGGASSSIIDIFKQ